MKFCEIFRFGQTPPSYGFGRYGFGFFGPRIAFRATGALWGRATPFFYHFSVHLSSVLGWTGLCHEVWTPRPQKPQIISNENHHLALLDSGTQTLENVARRKIHQNFMPNFTTHLWQRKTEKNFPTVFWSIRVVGKALLWSLPSSRLCAMPLIRARSAIGPETFGRPLTST